MAFTKSIVINAAPEKVFEYVSDLPRHSEWGKYKMKITPRSEGAVGVGSKYHHTGHQMGADTSDEVTIAEFAPGRRLKLESVSKDGQFQHTFELAPESGGTRLTKTFHVVKSGTQMKVFSPVIHFVAPQMLAEDVVKIKAHVEAPVTA